MFLPKVTPPPPLHINKVPTDRGLKEKNLGQPKKETVVITIRFYLIRKLWNRIVCQSYGSNETHNYCDLLITGEFVIIKVVVDVRLLFWMELLWIIYWLLFPHINYMAWYIFALVRYVILCSIILLDLNCRSLVFYSWTNLTIIIILVVYNYINIIHYSRKCNGMFI